MPDLHGWIAQQIDAVEAVAKTATPGPWHVTEYDWQTDFDAGIGTTAGEVNVVGHGYEGGGVERTEDARHIALHDPANVLRRCTADRKILTIHAPAGTRWDPYACNGCGVDSEYGHEVLHTNDCETLRALAEGYGLTEEQRAELDRPEPERPEPGPGFQMPDAIIESLYSFWAGTRPIEPSPKDKAVKILEPELKKIPGYVPTTEEPDPA